MTAFTPEQEAWVASRPPAVQARIRAYPPGFYRLTTTGHRVKILSYDEGEGGTCDTCTVLRAILDVFGGKVEDGQNYGVFGIRFDDLVPWVDDG